MNPTDPDVPHFATRPFASCLDFAEERRNGKDANPDLQAFMAKVHYGVAELQHA